MAGTVTTGLVQQVLAEGQFDTDQATALRWLTARQRTMMRDARAYSVTTPGGELVAGQSTYAFPQDIIEVERIGLGTSSPLDFEGMEELPKVDYDDGLAGGAGWAMVGTTALRIFPTPDATRAGRLLIFRGKAEAPDLSLTEDDYLVVPKAYHDDLVAGAIATGLARLEMRPDLAQPLEAEFTGAVEKLRRDAARRARGRGPYKIRFAR